MNNETLEIEDKRRIASIDFNSLMVQGRLGFYNSCEITQIYLHDKATKANTNIFAVACFSENSITAIEKKRISLKFVNQSTSVGIIQFIVPMNEATSLFEHAKNGSFQIGCDRSELSQHLVLLPKQYVPWLWGSSVPFLNKILKPNYYGGTYVIEFFDEEKDVLASLSREEVDRIHRSVSDSTEISVDLSKVYDRVGGLIFQFPITVLTCIATALKSGNGLHVSVRRHPKLDRDFGLNISCKTSIDDVVSGYSSVTINGDRKDLDLEIGDSNNVELFVSDTETKLLIDHSKMHFIREIRGNISFSMEHSPRRTIHTEAQKEPLQLNISSPMPMHIGRRRQTEYQEHIRIRATENEILSNSGDYLRVQQGDRGAALEFIRQKIQSASELKEILLWDPYLGIRDIVSTLYFETTGLPFRGITSLSAWETQQTTDGESDEMRLDLSHKKLERFERFAGAQMEQAGELSNNLGVNLDFRCQHDRYGYPFHDRFMILVPNSILELPTAYSLGTSINSFGRIHHLIQKVTNPTVILDDFNSLWGELDPEHCRVLHFPDDLRSDHP